MSENINYKMCDKNERRGNRWIRERTHSCGGMCQGLELPVRQLCHHHAIMALPSKWMLDSRHGLRD